MGILRDHTGTIGYIGLTTALAMALYTAHQTQTRPFDTVLLKCNSYAAELFILPILFP